MIYYLLPSLLWCSLSTWKAACTTTRFHPLHYVLALPLILLTILRGEVGPDTTTYLRNARDLMWWGDRASSNEIGYEALVRGLEWITRDPRVVVAVISLLAAVLFFVALHLWDAGRGTLFPVLIPFCYFDFTMNGLRMGIAFPLAVLAVLQLERKRPVLFYLLALAALSVQMTTALLLVLLLMARWGVRFSWRKTAYGLVLAAAVAYPAYLVFDQRIALKLVAYSIMESPNSLSGTGPLLMSLAAALLGVWICDRSHRYLGVAFFLIQLLFFGLSSVSYAGLRFQDMALFAQILALSYWALWPLRRRHLAAVLMVACIVCAWTGRNFLQSAGEPSAFLPYRFVWERR